MSILLKMQQILDVLLFESENPLLQKPLYYFGEFYGQAIEVLLHNFLRGEHVIDEARGL